MSSGAGRGRGTGSAASPHSHKPGTEAASVLRNGQDATEHRGIHATRSSGSRNPACKPPHAYLQTIVYTVDKRLIIMMTNRPEAQQQLPSSLAASGTGSTKQQPFTGSSHGEKSHLNTVANPTKDQ